MKAVTCFALVTCLALGVLSAPGDDYKTARSLVKALALTNGNLIETFNGLDVAGKKGDGLINLKDLNVLFWHGDAKFARAKFLRLITKGYRSYITNEEFRTFMVKESTVLAVIECRYVKSLSLREQCFADQVVTYIYLVLGKKNVEDFYNAIELKTDKDSVIKRNDVEQLKSKGLIDIDNFMEELGGNDEDGITELEFENYVTQEAISDDFRPCRESVTHSTGDAEYNMDCLVKELIEYTQDDLTEMDIALTFKAIDVNGDGIDVSDLKQLKECDEALATRIVKLLDKSGDKVINYAEFRTYLKTPTVSWRIEKECTEPKKTQAEELICIKDLVVSLFKDLHKPIWLVVPDLDMLFTFEEIDTSNNGFIEVESDLKTWDEDAKARFIKEADGFEKNNKIDLEEFNEYIGMPHMAYGVGDCMANKKDGTRLTCYIKELQDIFKNMIPNENIIDLYKHYNKKPETMRITGDDLVDAFPDEMERKYFLAELGMGDDTITSFEFTWYNKQQELSVHYVNGKDLSKEGLHKVLKDYINKYMTQYDIEETFALLDTNNDFELASMDYPDNSKWPKIVESIKSVGQDRHKTANFVEFWLWIHLKKGDQTRKAIFEEGCTTKHKEQAQEIQCYKDGILKEKEEGGLDLVLETN